MSFSAGRVKSRIRIAAVVGFAFLAWLIVDHTAPANGQSASSPSPAPSPEIFTTAHRTIGEAVEEFFSYRPKAVQPVQFTHKVHIANGMQCTDCHVGVDQGPDARIPSANFCMNCHRVIATSKPEIQKLTAYFNNGEDVPWQRVYGFEPSAHVKFNHAPHIRAGVACAQCHGDLSQQTVAVRAVDLNMGFCVECHRQHNVSVDCVTCHF